MEDQDPKDPETSLMDTLRSPDLSGILEDVAELGLDSMLTGVLKDVPIAKWVVIAGRAIGTFRDRVLVDKLLRFLHGLNEISEDEKTGLIQKIQQDNKYNKHVGETILMLLDRLDHLDKPYLISKLFCAYGRGKISYDDFLRISIGVERAFINDLNDVLKYYSATDPKSVDMSDAKRNLYSCNFSSFYVLSEDEKRRGGLEHPQIYHLNRYATKFAEIILGDKFQGGRW